MKGGKKVAIIQNRLQSGGRMQVMLHMIKVLNEMGYEPDVLTFKSRKTEAEYQYQYGITGLNFKIKPLAFNPKVPFEWNFILFNLLVGRRASKYDLVINNNNSSLFLKKRIKQVSYYHFPRKIRAVSEKRDIHFPDGPNKRWFDYKTDFFKLAKLLYKRHKKLSSNETIVANSEFTKQELMRAYALTDSQIEVLYPPISVTTLSDEFRHNNSVISLGRFAPDKRQLEQIKLAEKLPNYTFTLVGFVNDQTYFNSCVAYIKSHSIHNVVLKPNATKEEMEFALNTSQYFIHSLVNEPFGITVVQAINQGCLPIVHNSGGPKEIVPIDELRYNSYTDLPEIFKALAELSNTTKNEILRALHKNIERFDSKEFEEKWKQILITAF